MLSAKCPQNTQLIHERRRSGPSFRLHAGIWPKRGSHHRLKLATSQTLTLDRACGGEMDVLCFTPEGIEQVYRRSDLVPHAFTLK